MSRLRTLLFLLPCLLLADDAEDLRLIERATSGQINASLVGDLQKRFGDRLRGGDAWLGHQGRFLFVVDSMQPPQLEVDDAPVTGLRNLGNLYAYTTTLPTGRSHSFAWRNEGRIVGKRTDVSAYGPDSYPRPGVPHGKMSEMQVHTSKIYPDMRVEWWYYLSPGLDPKVPAPVMVWQDGQNYAREGSNTRLTTVNDNLLADKRIPAMVHIMIAPGKVGERAMRAIEYDTVNDTYVRFVLEEILPQVEKVQKLRTDGYSRAIGGESSGAICAFNAAWQRPQEFSRVLSRIGSYTSIQWRRKNPNPADNLDGGNIFPFLIRKEPKRDIRVWMEDGSEDLENNHGSWPLQNIQLANSLKMQGYDFRFRFGNATHNTANGNAMMPEALTWLWRGYDPGQTAGNYQQDPAEREKPYYRVRALNRE